MQIIITMAGLGQRFKDAGGDVAKPFVQVDGKPVLKHLTDVLPDDWKIFFAVGEHLKSDDTEKQIKNLNKNDYEIIYVPYSAQGPVDTVAAVLPRLELNKPVIVSYCDYTMIWDAADFLQQINITNADAAIVSYKGFQPTYLGPNSYCHLKVDENNFVTDLQEKKLYTDNIQKEWTSCGLYYFKSSAFLKECLLEQQKQNLCFKRDGVDLEFYTSLALLAIKNTEPKIKILNFQIKYFIQFGTPFDIQLYEYFKNYFDLNKN